MRKSRPIRIFAARGIEMGLVDTIQSSERVRPFAWPALKVVSNDHIALMRICGRHPRIWTQTYGESVLRITGPVDFQAGELTMRCEVAFGDQRLVVRTNEHALSTLFRTQNVAIAPSALAPPSAALAIEELVCDLLAPLERMLGAPFQVQDHRRATEAEIGPFVGLTVRSGDADVVDLAIFGSFAGLNRIADAIGERGRQQRRDDHRDVSFTARFFAPDLKLTSDQFRTLEAGGGLMLDHPWDRRRTGWLSLQDHLFAMVDHHEEGVKMTSPLITATEETPPSDPAAAASPAPAHSLAPVHAPAHATPRRPGVDARLTDGLPVAISVQLAERRMQLHEVQRLASGDVIKLEEVATTDVALLANGAYFAAAELVELDGKVAVRIKQID